jgi:hypothetical protein
MRTGNGNGSGTRPPQEIQAEIERTRNEMDGTLSALEQRLSPGQLIDQGMSYLRQNGAQEFVTNLGEQAKHNPMPVALVGIGLAWLMATGKMSGMSSASGMTTSKLGDAKDKISETASAMRDRATHMKESTRDQFVRARDGIDTMMREQPLALGALGLALGALAAALTPRTDLEDRLAGPVRDRMTEKAADELKQDPAEPVRPYADPPVETPPPFRGA